MKEKYSKITFKILIFIPGFYFLFLADQFMLPQKEISDAITAYSTIIVTRNSHYGTNSSKELLGYKYYTKKGYEFTLSKTYVEENEIVLHQSYIFQNINKVSTKSTTKDYSKELMSGLNGACLYVAIGLVFTAIISLFLLKFNKNLSENGFHNIILSNSFLTIVFLYLVLIFN
ncbi:hypothetical protein [Flavobacterium muglaense]|uniref:Uncharacterized protein n=1 Tax=Flavobacterium muglaense TaxID=2764716 RepID=A0A923N132_9FLAO|nr:hypothetical protein [Flavobacterium muglaense]MBC5837709.1 hypothetical protein [Flavobacterium muglaense]MBC5844175.1 hypothetical protein [Flavobacterium muglaense]